MSGMGPACQPHPFQRSSGITFTVVLAVLSLQPAVFSASSLGTRPGPLKDLPWWALPVEGLTPAKLSEQQSARSGVVASTHHTQLAELKDNLAVHNERLVLDQSGSSSLQLSPEDEEKLKQLQARQAAEWQALHTGFALEHLRLMVHTRAHQGSSAPDSARADSHRQGSNLDAAASRGNQSNPGPPHICFIIRTYWAHGAPELGGSGSLGALLRGLMASNHTQWEAQVVVMDGRPFDRLQDVVASAGHRDKRVNIFAQKVGPEYAARLADGNWNPKYHDLLYNLTDHAIQACAPTTRWVVITNGDNRYDPQFLSVLASVPEGHNLVAFDYYSRYQRVRGEPCLRFQSGPGLPPCKQNFLRFCQTDLATVAYDWGRFKAENRSFFALAADGVVSQQGLHDAIMVENLLVAGWKPYFIQGRCLLAHNPSPQMCALEGGVWDDHQPPGFTGAGGRCITPTEADEILANTPGTELLHVNVTHDSTVFGLSKYNGLLGLACVRMIPTGPPQNKFLPVHCVAPQDWGDIGAGILPAQLQKMMKDLQAGEAGSQKWSLSLRHDSGPGPQPGDKEL